MGLFSKEACTFCQTEVGMLKRSKLQTKEYICNDCKKKTNYFARMDHTSRAAAQRMMETMAQEAAAFEASFDSAENRFQSAERQSQSLLLLHDVVQSGQIIVTARMGSRELISYFYRYLKVFGKFPADCIETLAGFPREVVAALYLQQAEAANG